MIKTIHARVGDQNRQKRKEVPSNKQTQTVKEKRIDNIAKRVQSLTFPSSNSA